MVEVRADCVHQCNPDSVGDSSLPDAARLQASLSLRRQVTLRSRLSSHLPL